MKKLGFLYLGLLFLHMGCPCQNSCCLGSHGSSVRRNGIKISVLLMGALAFHNQLLQEFRLFFSLPFTSACPSNFCYIRKQGSAKPSSEGRKILVSFLFTSQLLEHKISFILYKSTRYIIQVFQHRIENSRFCLSEKLKIQKHFLLDIKRSCSQATKTQETRLWIKLILQMSEKTD